MHKWILLATGCKWLPVQFDAKCLPRTGSSLKAAPHYSLPSLPQQLNDRNTNKKESVAVLKQAFWPREGDRHAAAKPGWPPAPGGDGFSPLSSPRPHASELIPSVTRFSPLSKPHMVGRTHLFPQGKGGSRGACCLSARERNNGPAASHGCSSAWSCCMPCFLTGSFALVKAQPKLEGRPWSVTPKSSLWVSLVCACSASVLQELVPRGVSCPWKHICLLFLRGLVALVLAGPWIADFGNMVISVFHTAGTLCCHIV